MRFRPCRRPARSARGRIMPDADASMPPTCGLRRPWPWWGLHTVHQGPQDYRASLWVIDKHPGALRVTKSSCGGLCGGRPLSPTPMWLSSPVQLSWREGCRLLDAAANARCVVLAGPTASPWPPTFFARGVHILGGVQITDGPGAMRLVGEGASGYLLFSQVGRKVCVIREPDSP